MFNDSLMAAVVRLAPSVWGLASFWWSPGGKKSSIAAQVSSAIRAGPADQKERSGSGPQSPLEPSFSPPPTPHRLESKMQRLYT